MRRNNFSTRIVLTGLVVSLLSASPSAYATDYAGNTYIIRDPSITIFGGSSGGSSYKQINAGTVVGNGNSTGSLSFSSQSGPLHYPDASSGSGTLDQDSYRWYSNIDSLTPFTPLAADNAPITNAIMGNVYRLRIDVAALVSQLNSGSYFVLQYANTTGYSGCMDGGLSWNQVGASGESTLPFRGYDNPSVNDGTTLFSTLLSTASAGSAQTYEEFNLSYPSPNSITVNPDPVHTFDGEWDWVIENFKAPSNTHFCFRMIDNTSGPFAHYTNYPELTTGNPVVNFSLDSNSVNLGELSPHSIASASTQIIYSTNAPGGMSIFVAQDGNLRDEDNNEINSVSDGEVNSGSDEYGLYTGYDDFASDAPVTTEPRVVFSTDSPVASTPLTCTYKASISSLTPHGNYSYKVTYTAAANF